MVAVKAKYDNGKVELPPDLTGHAPCEVTILFPDEPPRKRKLGDSERFRRAAGAWSDMDCEALKRMIHESRSDFRRGEPPG
ncbi:MAG: hypothetical protein FJ291_28575 [Planctomycetes bacterium]|nr:hypothetical protein [Planctomycetota bacterium]